MMNRLEKYASIRRLIRLLRASKKTGGPLSAQEKGLMARVGNRMDDVKMKKDLPALASAEAHVNRFGGWDPSFTPTKLPPKTDRDAWLRMLDRYLK